MPTSQFCRWVAVVTTLLLVSGAFSTMSRAETAEEMASNCKEIVQAKVLDEGDRGVALSVPTDFSSGICWGAFLSFQSAITSYGYGYSDGKRDSSPTPFFGACAVKASTSQLVKVFVHYTDGHPERLNEDFFVVAVDAAQEAFPCKSAP